MSNAQRFFAKVGRSIPGVEALSGAIAGSIVQRLLGFWVMWHLAGGLEPLIEAGWLSRSTVYRQRGQFHRVLGTDVDVFWPEAVAFFVAERARVARESV